MSDFRIDQITNQSGTAGPDIAGITTFSSTSGMLMPSGVTEYRGGRGRGVFAGGYTNSPSATSTNIIDYITIATAGNALDFGDLSSGRQDAHSCASSTRGLFGGGDSNNRIDFVTISSTGNAFNFGTFSALSSQMSACEIGRAHV